MPAWPSTVSLSSPGFQTNVSLPAPSNASVVAVAADDEVVALAAEEHVGTQAAVEREADHAGGERRGVDRVVAAPAVDDQLVSRAPHGRW